MIRQFIFNHTHTDELLSYSGILVGDLFHKEFPAKHKLMVDELISYIEDNIIHSKNSLIYEDGGFNSNINICVKCEIGDIVKIDDYFYTRFRHMYYQKMLDVAKQTAYEVEIESN